MLTTILPAISNAATWRDQVEVRDEDDDLVDLETDVDEITLSLRDPESGAVVKSITMSGGDIDVGGSLGDGIAEFSISVSDMANIPPKTYEVGMLVEMASGAGGDTVQLILGRQPIVRGL